MDKIFAALALNARNIFSNYRNVVTTRHQPLQSIKHKLCSNRQT